MREYFPHDYNARNDRKMTKLKITHRMTGIGIYWSIVEMLYEESGKMLLADIPMLADELRTDIETVESVIKDFELFLFNEKSFWSESVLKRLNERNIKTDKAKAAADKRWSKTIKNPQNNANALHPQTDGNAIKEKERKETYNAGEFKIEDHQDFAADILKYFGFTQMTNPDKHRTINAFLKTQFEAGRLEYFKEQYLQYKSFKNLSGEKRHNFTSFLGLPSERFEGGKWDEANWKEKNNQATITASMNIKTHVAAN